MTNFKNYGMLKSSWGKPRIAKIKIAQINQREEIKNFLSSETKEEAMGDEGN